MIRDHKTIPIAQRILDDVTKFKPLQGKERDMVIRWIKRRADRALEKVERAKAIRANPVRLAAENRRADASGLLTAADDAFSILVRTIGTQVQDDGRRWGYCITCKTKKLIPFSELQAGHWKKRGKFGARFMLENVHPQCDYCNDPRRGNGREPEHEAYILYHEGAGAISRILVAVKLRPKKPGNLELAEMAKAFMARAVALGYVKGKV